MKYQQSYVTLMDQKNFNPMANLLFENYRNLDDCCLYPLSVITLNKTIDGYEKGTKFVYIDGAIEPQRKINYLFTEMDYKKNMKDSTVFLKNPFLYSIQIIPSRKMHSDKIIFDKESKIATHQDFINYWKEINNKDDNAKELISIDIDMIKKEINLMEYINYKDNYTADINSSKVELEGLITLLKSLSI